MNIASTQYSLNYRAFEIYLAGCNGSCEGCCNPELKDFNVGKYYKLLLNEIIGKIRNFSGMINKIWVLGGDPLDQNIDDLCAMLEELKFAKKEMWIWTRCDINSVPLRVKKLCDYIKCGAYDADLRSETNIQYDIKLATSNQYIYKMEDFMDRVKVAIQKLDDDVVLPTYAKSGDAGMDIRANTCTIIPPGDTKVVPTGIKVAIPEGYEIQVRPRSGLSYNTPLRVANSPGTIDSGYRDEIGVIITNTSATDASNFQTLCVSAKGNKMGTYQINKGDRIAQLVVKAVPQIIWEEVKSVDNIGDNRNGGFGSSGVD